MPDEIKTQADVTMSRTYIPAAAFDLVSHDKALLLRETFPAGCLITEVNGKVISAENLDRPWNEIRMPVSIPAPETEKRFSEISCREAVTALALRVKVMEAYAR
jgi:hypothetical protein